MKNNYSIWNRGFFTSKSKIHYIVQFNWPHENQVDSVKSDYPYFTTCFTVAIFKIKPKTNEKKQSEIG